MEELVLIKSHKAELEDQNRFLMEDAESYQILLQERTLNGEFINSSAIMQRGEELAVPGEGEVSNVALSVELGGVEGGDIPADIEEELEKLRNENKRKCFSPWLYFFLPVNAE
jgi:hypothetical protein